MKPRAIVVRVIDGDTLWVRLRVRLQTSAPELTAPGGHAAKEAIMRKYPQGYRAVLNIESVDGYGRLIASLSPDRTEDL